MNNFENARILKAFGDEHRLDILTELPERRNGSQRIDRKIEYWAIYPVSPYAYFM